MAGELTETELDDEQPRDDLPSNQLDSEATTIEPAETALSVRGLSKTFGSGEAAVPAVKDVSFAVDAGDIVGLLGPNGAGKTTTIKAILGLILPDEGEVRIRGHDPYDQPRPAYQHVDAMFEGARNDYWRLTVRENLRYFAAIKGQNPDAVADRHEALLERFDIAHKADTQVRDLSRGMKQKVALASVLASNSSIVFLDEPTLGLDVETSLALRRELVRLAEERGTTLLLASHDTGLVEAVCDRVLVMNNGHIVANSTVEALLADCPETTYRITARKVDDTILSDLQDRFDLTIVRRVDGQTRFEVSVDSTGFYRLTDVMERHGLVLVTVDSGQPELADAIVEMTGDGESAVPSADDGRGGYSR